MIFETHAHLHDAAFDADRGAVIERARNCGVARFVTVGCDLADSARARAVAREYGIDWSIGIHPHEAKDAPADITSAFDEALAGAKPAPIAVGETGLDYYYDHSPRDVQRHVMRAQVRYARERGLPIIFHQRDAFDDFTGLLREEWQSDMRGVVHCFTGDSTQARCFSSEFGLFLGIGGVVTFKTAQGLRDAVVQVGLERLLLETDCPYLAPVPHRGRRNEPAFLLDTAQTLATLFAASLDLVAATTAQNAVRLFTTS